MLDGNVCWNGCLQIHLSQAITEVSTQMQGINLYVFMCMNCNWLFSLLTSPATMELNDANLQTLTEFLLKTLNPDPLVRRPGRISQNVNLNVVVFFFLSLTLLNFTKQLSSHLSSSGEVSRVGGGESELPHPVTDHVGEVPRWCDPSLCCSHL